jgi:hypothetical protein
MVAQVQQGVTAVLGWLGGVGGSICNGIGTTVTTAGGAVVEVVKKMFGM